MGAPDWFQSQLRDHFTDTEVTRRRQPERERLDFTHVWFLPWCQLQKSNTVTTPHCTKPFSPKGNRALPQLWGLTPSLNRSPEASLMQNACFLRWALRSWKTVYLCLHSMFIYVCLYIIILYYIILYYILCLSATTTPSRVLVIYFLESRLNVNYKEKDTNNNDNKKPLNWTFS